MGEHRRLDNIAFDVYHNRADLNHFLKSFAGAWLQADQANKSILAPAWGTFIEKYNLG